MWCHLKYKDKSWETYEEYTELFNKEIKYLLSKKWDKVPKGILRSHLPSFHPYWHRESRKGLKESYDFHLKNFHDCFRDEEKIKFLYNKSTTLDTIRMKIIELHNKIYK